MRTITTLAWLVLAAGCAAKGSLLEDGPPSDGAGGQGTGGQPELAGGCDPDCADDEICSVASVCIPEGSCLDDGDCGGGMICDQEQCVPGGGCSEQHVTGAVGAEMLLVVDRSCSMNHAKWQAVVDAVGQVTTTYEGTIHFGMTLFPEPLNGFPMQSEACLMNEPIPVPVGPGTVPTIQSLLDDTKHNGPCVTNIDAAMDQAATAEPALHDDNLPSYVVLMTDGAQYGCNTEGGDAGTLAIIEQLHAQGIGTFVVGFAIGSGTHHDPDALNGFALAGGHPVQTSPGIHYYDAVDAGTLAAAFASIASEAVGCSFVLDAPPQPGEVIHVFAGGDELSEDPVDGYTYDPETQTVTLHGSTCDNLESGVYTGIDVVIECGESAPPK